MNLLKNYNKISDDWKSENNLLVKLKPEFTKKLNQRLDEFPHSTRRLISALESETFITELKYTYVLDLECSFNVSNIYYLFDEREPFHEYIKRNGYDG